MLVCRYMPFVRDAIFTLASGLHEVLEVKRVTEYNLNGSHLHEVIKQNGFADGITGNIDFESKSADRDFFHKDFIVFNFQGAKFVRVGTIVAETPEFKDCEQYKKAYNGTALSKDCKTMIFRGLYERITLARASSHLLSICIVVALAFWTDGTEKAPKVREFREFTFSFLCCLCSVASLSKYVRCVCSRVFVFCVVFVLVFSRGPAGRKKSC